MSANPIPSNALEQALAQVIAQCPERKAARAQLARVVRRLQRIAWAGVYLGFAAGPGAPAHAAEVDQPIAATASAASAPAAGAVKVPAPLPVAMFFRHADIGDAVLSPSGRQLAVTVAREGRLALGLIDLATGAPKVLVYYTDRDIRSFWWVGEDHLVYSLVDQQAGSADQPSAPGLFAVAVADGEVRQLVQLRQHLVTHATRLGVRPLEWNHQLLTVPDDGSHEVIVGRLELGADWQVRKVLPLRLDVRTGRTRSLALGMPAGTTDWWFDSRGTPRVAMLQREGLVQVHWRGPGDEAWRLLASHPATRMPWLPHSVADDGALFVTVPEEPDATSTLYKFDLGTAQPTGEPIVRTPGFDFTGRWVRAAGPRADGRFLGLHLETDAATSVWFDPQLRAWQADADQALPGRINRLSCRRCQGDDPVLLVHSASDREPGEYYLYRPRQGKGAWDRVARTRPDVDPRRMATLDFHRVTTRDGQQMPVWLTLPAGALADRPSPRSAVVLVHGGPWTRGGHWQWHDTAQFLASRGHVVIEPEFRGSAGYGGRWLRAGFRQWGRAMQDDLADALAWAVTQGWVDSKRVCIAGASYGGYAALMGPVRHPGLYRCVVSWVAATDLRLLFDNSMRNDLNDETRLYSLPEMLGDPVTDAQRLADDSPVNHAERIGVPVLLAFGARDRRVQLAHGERMREALVAAGKSPEWVVYPEEGHGWLLPENRLDFGRRMERFLAEHLQ